MVRIIPTGKDYTKYVKDQTEVNEKKINRVFEYEQNIQMLCMHLKKHLEKIEFGICHGTRRGKEQTWFKKYLNCNCIGTEISYTAAEFPDTIHWDFHDLKPEWFDKFDFLYSNSLDHSFDMKYCLAQWAKSIRKDGLIIINGTTAHTSLIKSKGDVNGYSKDELITLMSETPGLEIIDTIKGIRKPWYYPSWYYVIARKT